MSWRRKIVWDGYRRIVLNSSKIHSGVKFSTRIMTALRRMIIWYLLRVIPFLLSQVQTFLMSFSTPSSDLFEVIRYIRPARLSAYTPMQFSVNL